MIQSDKFLHAENIAWENPEPGVTRQILGYDDQLMLVKVVFEKGAVGSAHRHPHSQTTLVESGKFEATIDGETAVLSAGDGYYVAPNLLHGCVCLEAGMLVDTFSPHRADFLK